MPHPKEGYHAADGKRVPGTTTIISRFKESSGLIHWAWEQGVAGLDYRDERDTAADIGTLAHAMMEAKIHGLPFVVPADADPANVEKAVVPFHAFEQWAGDVKFTITDTEVALVSEKYRYGGTLDACLIRGERSIGDWKTSNRVYADHIVQLAAYRNLWNETHPDDRAAVGAHLVRFAKETGDFTHHFFADLDEAWRAFVLMRELYGLMASLKKRV